MRSEFLRRKDAPAARHLARRSSPDLARGLFEFEQGTGQGVVIGFEQAKAFDQLADFGTALIQQFGLLAFEASLFFSEGLEVSRNRWLPSFFLAPI